MRTVSLFLLVMGLFFGSLSAGFVAGAETVCVTATLSSSFSCKQALNVGDGVEMRIHQLFRYRECRGDVTSVDTSFWPYSADIQITKDVKNCPYNVGDTVNINWNVPTPKKK